ncbi:MAG: hypothetical protein WCK01_01015 [Candidatus Uhrbacteria bacterium]
MKNVPWTAIEKWLWSRYLVSLFLVLVPIAFAGLVVGVALANVDDVNAWYLAALGMLTVFDLAIMFAVGEIIFSRYVRLQRWREYMSTDLHAHESKKFAREVAFDYELAHQAMGVTDA